MLRNVSIGRRLVGVLLGIIVLAGVVQGVSFTKSAVDLGTLHARSTALLHLQDDTSQLADAIHDQQDGVRDYVDTRNAAAVQTYATGRATELNALGSMAGLVGNFPGIADDVQAIRLATDQWRIDFLGPTVGLVQANQLDQARSIGNLDAGSALFAKVIGPLDALEAHVTQLNRENLAEIDRIIREQALMFVLGVLGALAGAVLALTLVGHWVVRPLGRLLSIAHRVESGEDVAFPSQSSDEIGRLGGDLERMRVGLYSQAAEASVVNRFTELTAFVEADADVARAALDALQELVEPDDGAIHVSNRSKDRAVPEGSIGAIVPEIVALGQLASCPGVRRSSLYVTKDLGERLSVHCPVYPATAGTLACIPLLALGEVVGSVHLHWARADALPLDVRGAVARITEHASLSVANRRLLIALQGMASTDGRTGLANSRTFDQALEDALSHREDTEQLSVLMLDIDHFKLFNDRHGHPAGDEALRAFAGVLRNAVRGQDLAARYGGEEFAVILPGLPSEGAAVVAERIRARLEETLIALSPTHSDRLTVSIGVASAPADATDRIELLKVADSALYRAKNAGRNRVVVAGQEFVARKVAAGTEPGSEDEPTVRTGERAADVDGPKLRELGAA